MLTCLDLDLAKRGTRQKTLHTFLAGPRKWPRGNLFNLINFHNLSWWAPKFSANNGKRYRPGPAHCVSSCQSASPSASPSVSQSVIHSVWQSDSLPRIDLTFLLHWMFDVGGSWAAEQRNLNCFVNVLWLESRPWFDLFMKIWRHLD